MTFLNIQQLKRQCADLETKIKELQDINQQKKIRFMGNRPSVMERSKKDCNRFGNDNDKIF
ncbi:MAG: hypothetical protein ACXWE7_14315 [Nitrososphaeraceae archaeon]